MKTYREIDLNDTPIVVLGCNHFFTTETLDGHMGIAEVYLQDERGEFTGLRDVSAELARSIPRCPNCQCPVRQHCTKRFNRVINRAVIDEMSKQFLVNGKDELRKLERQIVELEQDLKQSSVKIHAPIISPLRQLMRNAIGDRGQLTATDISTLTQTLRERNVKSGNLENAIRLFGKKVADKNQPAQKLHDATVHAARQKSIDQLMTNLDITKSVPAIARNQLIIAGGRIAQVQAASVILADRLNTTQTIRAIDAGSPIRIPGGAPEQLAKPFFKTCGSLIDDCAVENLSKIGTEATIYYAQMARLYESYCHSTKTDPDQASQYVKTARELLLKARALCKQLFENADVLRDTIEELIKVLRKEWYESVTAEELGAIKDAMVSGPRGIGTHSGHWYNCANGHPVSHSGPILECISIDRIIVCDRRMWNAHGNGPMPGMRGTCWWTKSSCGRWGHSCHKHGTLIKCCNYASVNLAVAEVGERPWFPLNVRITFW